jgi:hypothetical protein
MRASGPRCPGESVTRVAETGVPDAEFAEIQKQFSEKEIVDLTLIISVMNAWNRMAISFRQGPAVRPVTSWWRRRREAKTRPAGHEDAANLVTCAGPDSTMIRGR